MTTTMHVSRIGRRALLLAVVLLLALAPVASAYKPATHRHTAEPAVQDVLDDGRVSLTFDTATGPVTRSYPVDPAVVAALRDQPASFNAGVIGPDGFPDVVFGQSMVHPEGTGLWLDHLLTAAWAAQEDPLRSATERQQILAFTYGFVLHAVGDVWAHTFVNDLSDGVFPSVGELDGATERAIALRHVIVEGYVEDATPGFDGDPAEEPVDTDGDGRTDDLSTTSSPALPIDAPLDWLYDVLVSPGAALPVGTCFDGIDDDGDGTADDGCPGGPFTVGDPEPQRGVLIDGFLDLQADLQVLEAQLALDVAQVDCAAVDPDCETRTETRDVLTVRGVQRITEDVRVCIGATIGCLPDALDVADDVSEELLRRYIAAWIEDIRVGLIHWPELGLATTRGLFDPQTFRNAQNDLCEVRGADTFDNVARRNCERGIGTTDVVQWAAEDFRDDYLLSMLGAPDLAGDVIDALQVVSGVIDDIVGASANPLRLAGDELRQLAVDYVDEQLEIRYGIDGPGLRALLSEPTDALVRNELELGDAGGTISLFADDDLAALDELFGLSPLDRELRPLTADEAERGLVPRYQLRDGATYDVDAPPLRNTTVMSKLALLGGPALDELLSDAVGQPVTWYGRFPHANVMTVGADSAVTSPPPDLVPGPIDPTTLPADTDVAVDAADGITATARIGDVNGDGIDDWAFGQSQAARTGPTSTRGRIVVVHGPLTTPTFLDALNLPGGPTGFTVLGAPGDGIGATIEPVGDVDGDGAADLVTLSWQSGRPAHVVLGDAASDPVEIGGASGATRVRTIRAGDGLLVGRSVAGLGDVDGDGLDDVAVTARPFGSRVTAIVHGATTTATVDVGAAYVAAQEGTPVEGISIVVNTDEAAVAGPGDIAGGPDADVVIVEEQNPPVVRVLRGGTLRPLQYLFCEDTETTSPLCDGGPTVSSHPVPRGTGATDVFTRAAVDVAGVGDVTGDGIPDTALVSTSGTGSSNVGRGLLHVVSGTPADGTAWTAAATARVVGPSGSDGSLGLRTVREVGDLDGDGLPDLGLVSLSTTDEAQVTVVYGGASGTLDADALTSAQSWGRAVTGDGLLTPFAWDDVEVAGVPDRDGDGTDELAIQSAPTFTATASGEVRLLDGATRPLVAAPDGGGDEGPTVDVVPWLTSIDADHAWRADSRPRAAAPGGGNGTFPLWEDCILRDAVWRPLFTDWEDPLGRWPALGDAPRELLPGSSGCALDGDGIAAAVDGRFVDGAFVDESRVGSTSFTDQPGGTTAGQVVGPVEVEDVADDPDRGVVLRGLGTSSATVCTQPTFQVLLDDGDVGVATCGSITLAALVGDLELVHPLGLVITVPEGTTVTVDDGTISNAGPGAAPLSDGRVVAAGEQAPVVPGEGGDEDEDGDTGGEETGGDGGDSGTPEDDGDAPDVGRDTGGDAAPIQDDDQDVGDVGDEDVDEHADTGADVGGVIGVALTLTLVGLALVLGDRRALSRRGPGRTPRRSTPRRGG